MRTIEEIVGTEEWVHIGVDDDTYFIILPNPDYEAYKVSCELSDRAWEAVEKLPGPFAVGQVVTVYVDGHAYKFEVALGCEKGFNIACKQYEGIYSKYFLPHFRA